MKLPPFTLVYRLGQRSDLRKVREVRLVHESQRRPEDFTALESLSNFRAPVLSERSGATLGSERDPKFNIIGFWDLSSQVGELPRVIEALNASQTVCAFFEVQAAIPSGLISCPERVIAWAKEKLSDKGSAEIKNNVIYEDFAKWARQVRSELGLDYLIGFTPAMVAFEEQEDLHWNYFSAGENGISLVSTYEIYSYARKARRSFEAAVAGIALSSLLATLNPKIEYHEENRGCLFDFNRDRESIVQAMRRSEIEPSCLALIEPEYREAAVAMVGALRKLDAPTKSPTTSSKKSKPETRGRSVEKSGSQPRSKMARKT